MSRAHRLDEWPGGFSWTLDEPMTRTSHALVTSDGTWLVDPVDLPDAIRRATASAPLLGVLQLLDRHNRDCAAIAERLGVPHLVVPAEIPGSRFEVIDITRSRRWREVALWWPEQEALVVAEAVGTSRFYAPSAGAGVHLLARLSPPRAQLGRLEPRHLLVGHGPSVHGEGAGLALAAALAESRRRLPHALATLAVLATEELQDRIRSLRS